MSINESKIVRRERWPLAFDLEGVPRDNAERARLLELQRSPQISQEETLDMSPSPVNNVFAVDQPAGDQVFDINNPPNKRYVHREFPKMVYHHESGHVLTVADANQHAAAVRRGFQDQPASDRDYSKVRSGMVAPMKESFQPREQELTLDQIEALEAAELEALQTEEQKASTAEEADAIVANALGESDNNENQAEQQEAPRSRGRNRR